MDKLVIADNEDEFVRRLPEVGRSLVGLFHRLPAGEVDHYAQQIFDKAGANPKYLVGRHDIPPVVDRLTKKVAVQNGFQERDNWKMTGRARVFGITHPKSGAHIDTNISTTGEQMPLLGSWALLAGDCRVSLAEIPAFSSGEVHRLVEELRIDTDDPEFELGMKIRPEKIDQFGTLDVRGPHMGVWAVGMSQTDGVYTVLHQVETLGEAPRVSTNLLQNYTNRQY